MVNLDQLTKEAEVLLSMIKQLRLFFLKLCLIKEQINSWLNVGHNRNSPCLFLFVAAKSSWLT